jgi:GAF domain-containing protein
MDQTNESGQGLQAEELGALADLASAESDEIVERALAVARDVLGLDLAYMTQFTDDDQVYKGTSGDADGFKMREGGSLPLEGTYCQRMVLGRIPNLVRDTAEEDELRDLKLTKDADIGSYVGVPITLSDGTVYGTICAASHEAAPELAEKDVKFMHVLARIVGAEVEQARLANENNRLRGRVDALKVEVDQKAQREQVEELTSGDWFQELSERAQALRKMAGGSEESAT